MGSPPFRRTTNWCFNKLFVDEVLGSRFLAAALSNGDKLGIGAGFRKKRGTDQRVVKHTVCLHQQLQAANGD
jgi:hypothetical protein